METKDIIQDILPFINMAEIAQTYFHKGRGWLNHKVNRRIVNGVQYSLSRSDIEILSGALKDISAKLHSTSLTLDALVDLNIKEYGRYYTEGNPFNYTAFQDWYNAIPKSYPIIEPFAGSCNIPHLFTEAGYDADWQCYDINPERRCKWKVTKRDTIAKFPRGKVVITNPPFLAKNSAKRNGIPYPKSEYDNLYKHCLDLILHKTDYAAVILPDSFISAPEMKDRVSAIISINEKMFNDTDYPVCLALFVPEKTRDFPIYIGNKFIGTYQGLQNSLSCKVKTDWIFNSPTGSIGVYCVDSSMPTIRFVFCTEIEPTKIKDSNRAYTRISGLPDNISISEFIQRCNEVLCQYRNDTSDVLLTSFKGLRKDRMYRKRISFSTIRDIMNFVLYQMQNKHPK